MAEKPKNDHRQSFVSFLNNLGFIRLFLSLLTLLVAIVGGVTALWFIATPSTHSDLVYINLNYDLAHVELENLQVVDLTILVERGQGLTGFESAVPLSADISPDGKFVAYQASYQSLAGSNVCDLVILDTDSLERQARLNSDESWCYAFPAWSPDSQQVAFLSYHSAYSLASNAEVLVYTLASQEITTLDVELPAFASPILHLVWVDNDTVEVLTHYQTEVSSEMVGIALTDVTSESVVPAECLSLSEPVMLLTVSFPDTGRLWSDCSATPLVFPSWYENYLTVYNPERSQLELYNRDGRLLSSLPSYSSYPSWGG